MTRITVKFEVAFDVEAVSVPHALREARRRMTAAQEGLIEDGQSYSRRLGYYEEGCIFHHAPEDGGELLERPAAGQKPDGCICEPHWCKDSRNGHALRCPLWTDSDTKAGQDAR